MGFCFDLPLFLVGSRHALRREASPLLQLACRRSVWRPSMRPSEVQARSIGLGARLPWRFACRIGTVIVKIRTLVREIQTLVAFPNAEGRSFDGIFLATVGALYTNARAGPDLSVGLLGEPIPEPDI